MERDLETMMKEVEELQKIVLVENKTVEDVNNENQVNNVSVSEELIDKILVKMDEVVNLLIQLKESLT